MLTADSFELDGSVVRYLVTGSESSSSLVYVHGTGCNANVWSRHMEAVADDFRCIAIDLPGHGGSGGAGYRGVADYAFAVNALAEHLNLSEYVLLGHSLGGGIALAVATYFPERLSGMVLVDTGARLRVATETLDVARRLAAGEDVPAMDRRWTYAESTPDSVIDQVVADLGEVDPDLVYRDWIADDTFDFLNRVSQITTRTLAIGGTEDPITPVRNHVFFQGAMPDCDLVLLEQCGHWPMYEKPEAFDQLIRDFATRVSTL